MKPRRIIVIHCTATPPSMDIGVDEVRQWHLNRGWSDSGYHGIIRRSGKYEPGRPLGRVPAAQRGFNRGTLALALVGGVDAQKRPQDNFTKAQRNTLIKVINRWREQYDVLSIAGHRDFPRVAKDCPSFHVLEWVYKNLLFKSE